MSGRRSAGSVAALLLGVAAAFLVWNAEWQPDLLAPGESAPGFELPRLEDGSAMSLADQRGKVVLLNFWATWCKPCEDEMPAMQRLYEGLREEGFELLAISVDDGRAEVEAFQERLGLGFPILLDPEKRVAGRYQSFRFPESWLVDREGELVARFVGPREWDDPMYVARIRALLEGDEGRAAAEPGAP